MSLALLQSEWDYIILGGGLAGIIVAARLSADARHKVLLVEAGARQHSPLLRIPAGETLLMGNPRYDWLFETEPDPTLCGRCIPIPRGRLLGGSNAINGMLFVRGQQDDYDSWARLGLRNWDWASVLPWFRSLEDWQGGDADSRGSGGPIRVELPRQREPLCDAFLKAGCELGYALNPDYNSGDQEGFGYYQCTQSKGVRHSVLDGYLKNGADQRIAIATRVTAGRLLLENAKCIGVECWLGGQAHHVRAHKEVIVCSGVIGSPHILQLSGIGDPSALQRAGITPRVNSPDVGRNFKDHFAIRLRWRLAQQLSFNERTKGAKFLRELLRYAIQKRGVLSMPIAIGHGFVRSRPEEVVPDLQLHFAPATYDAGSTRSLEAAPGMTIGVYPSRPESNGMVHAKCSDQSVAPAIATNFLAHEEDQRRLIAGFRITEKIAGAHAFLGLVERRQRLYPAIDSDDEILDFARQTGSTSFHPIGTCRMGGDTRSVVDERLRVRGVDGLRIVDASVMPTMVSGNTQAATMMIAERGAHFISSQARTA